MGFVLAALVITTFAAPVANACAGADDSRRGRS
jgi:hypothetical protein